MKTKIVTPVELFDNEIYDARGRLVARCWREDVGKILIQKVNSHDALLEACKAWMKVESEMSDNTPCPDLALRAHYRKEAVKLTEAAIAQAQK